MARINVLVDDILLALNNERVDATGKEKVIVPAEGTLTGRKRTATFDVSPKGRDAIKKMVADAEAASEKARVKAEEQIRAAWRPILDIMGGDETPAAESEKPAPAAPQQPEQQHHEPQHHG